jgi:hypothetical protein
VNEDGDVVVGEEPINAAAFGTSYSHAKMLLASPRSLGAVSGAQVVICQLPRQLSSSLDLFKQLTSYYAN